jgi:hypothetical protein
MSADGLTKVPLGSKLLRLVRNPPEGLHWTCAGCGERYFGVPPEDGICTGCHVRRRHERQQLTREQAFELAGVPARCAKPFAEPGPKGLHGAWPTDGRGGDSREWAAAGWCLLLTGNVGSGKSMFAAELLWRAARDSRVLGRWCRAQQLADLTLTGASAELRTLVEAPMLVVDDLGVGHDSPAAWGAVEGALCCRWECERGTIITTNLTRDALVNRSAPLADRLRDGMACRVDGRSLRGRP